MKRVYVFVLGGVVIVGILVGLMLSSKNKAPVQEILPKDSLLKEAQQVLSEKNLIKAKELYQEAMAGMENTAKIEKVRSVIESINMEIIFSPVIDDCSMEYTVKPKDALSKIAKKFDTTVELIKKANGLDSDTIRPGQKLKINTCPFSLVVDKSQNLLFLKRKGEVIKTYLVSTGKDNSTPIGNFKIVNKLANPTWFRSGAVIPPDSSDNILGTRWLGFDLKGYGIHGTTEPEQLGKQITLGCVRMRNSEVEEIYTLIPVGTEVTIVD